jgi:cell division septation protein DedD
MARPSRPRGPWQAIFTAGALVLVAIPGFALGLMAGLAWEEPGLLASHLLGRTREVIWAGRGEEPAAADPAAAEEAALPAVAAPPAPEAVAPPPAPGPARQPAPPAAPAPKGRFAVQVGAFAESQGAERLAEDLRAKGFPVYVSPGAAAGGPRWRVRVGPHATREQAERAADRLERQEKLPTWVLDEDGAA